MNPARTTATTDPNSEAEPGSTVDTVGQMTDTPQSVVYFDGSCPLCSAEIRHYASRDAQDLLRFVDVSQPNQE